ncbi:MAG: signal peptidase I [Lentisphaerae bacterium RIFOXYA12_FULL_48_11]|nr:MAG: signal peptidase I [Lentisphaerae bacterium RIFOXYA12_FULL_48_11]
MKTFFRRRKANKLAEDILKQSQHLRNIREDLMRETDLKKLIESEETLKEAIRGRDPVAVENASESLFAFLNKVIPSGRPTALAENFEILIVAVVVAMGFRTYFIQPFKIPTGSMEPTLNGIHSDAHTNPTIMDQVPLKYLKWIVFGEWYMEIRIREDGVLGDRAETTPDETSMYVYVGNVRYKIPRGARPRVFPGTLMKKGAILWSGKVTTGDHVFVDKVRWNFSRPKRGQVMVFLTKNIQSLPENTHYIKRLIGLPNESISINPPNILINGKIVNEPEGIRRISQQAPGYSGYTIPYSYAGTANFISSSNEVRKLGPADFFVLGDNTGNSRDGRYWGAVPEKNTIGPAVLVYWPYSQRWGRIN